MEKTYIFISEQTISLISELNKRLNIYCPGLQLTVLKNDNNSFQLCLIKNKEMLVFNLSINFMQGTFNINYNKKPNFEDRGYWKFLTAVIIYLADTMQKRNDFEEVFVSTNTYKKYCNEITSILSDYKFSPTSKINEDEYMQDYRVGIPVLKDGDNHFFVDIERNKDKAISIIEDWINTNKCAQSEATVDVGGKKTRRNKQRRKSKKTQRRKNKTQRRKNKTQRRKSKKTQNKKII